VAVLTPASRPQELRYLMPLLFETARRLQRQVADLHCWIALSTEKFREPIARAARDYGLRHAFIPAGANYDALAAADVLLTKSGTVNLEAALLDLPQVVAYRVAPLTYAIGKLIRFKIPFASPVNLVEMREVVPEFLQERATPEALVQAALPLLTNPEAIARIREGYACVRASLGGTGAIERGAEAILDLLDRRSVPHSDPARR
jgi:lipid-A-disaccharide synthase